MQTLRTSLTYPLLSLMFWLACSLTAGAQAVAVGPLNPNATLTVVINPALQNEAGLDSLLAGLYNPKSPGYHKYLTPGQFDSQYAASAASVGRIVAWAEDQGLVVAATASNNRNVTVTGSVAALNHAFHVFLTVYRDAKLGRTFYGPDRQPAPDLTVPLAAVHGLGSGKGHVHTVPGTSNFGDTRSTNYTGSGPYGSYIPSDMRAAYYGSGPLTGAGQTVAVLGDNGYPQADLQLFFSKSGFTSSVPVKNVLVGGYSGACHGYNDDGSFDYTTCSDSEQLLDITDVMGMAPGLTQILFYEGATPDAVLNQVVIDNAASVVSNSALALDSSYEPYFKQMAAQGMTFVTASGDGGSYDPTVTNSLAVSAYTTVVGGTVMLTAGPGGPLVSETGWGSSGGGYEATGDQPLPDFQQLPGVVSAANGASATARNYPDLSAAATNMCWVNNGNFYVDGWGTSNSAPFIAGYIALANQQAAANGLAPVGFLNPKLYAAGTDPAGAGVFNDVASGSNGAYSATPGYDLVTGWGSPNGPALINYLAGSPLPDFSVALAAPSLTFVRGNYAQTALTFTVANGFTAPISVTTSGLPQGMTLNIKQAPGYTNVALVTATASPTAIPGTYPVTITALSGILAHSVTLTVNVMFVANTDFSLTASAVTVQQGSTGNSTVTIQRGSAMLPQMAFTLSGLPEGVSATVAPSNGGPATVTFAPSLAASPGDYTITLTGTSLSGISHQTTISLTVTALPSLLGNGNFEAGVDAPWTSTYDPGNGDSICDWSCGDLAHTGDFYEYLNGYGYSNTYTLAQQVTLPASGKLTLAFWLYVATQETTATTQNATLQVQVTDTAGNVLATVGSFSNLDGQHKFGYKFHSFDLSGFAGQTVSVQFTGTEGPLSKGTGFLIDDVALVAQ